MACERPHFGVVECLALTATAVLHTGYSLVLQAGYRTSDLSLVYPIARGSGPLLSFVGATILLGERPTLLAGLGLVSIVAGITRSRAEHSRRYLLRIALTAREGRAGTPRRSGMYRGRSRQPRVCTVSAALLQ